ncbi:MAG: methionyl-tRNA formyltransferase [Acidobacteriota bacterium]
MVDRPARRIVFFGTPAFAVPSLEALLHSPHQVAGVVTQPDRPRGRGQHTSDGPVKAAAIAAGLPVLQPDRMKDEAFLDQLTALEADLGVVAAYGRILTDRILAVPPMGMVNVHASLLPRYRGAAPVHRAVIAGESETGVTIMRVVRALDAGPMLGTIRRPIGPDDTSEDVERDLARLGAALLLSAIDGLVAGTASEVPQNEAAATYAARLTREDGLVDWQASAGRIHDLVRGLHPWPHAYTFLDGRRFILHRSRAVHDSPPSACAPGVVVEASPTRLAVAAGSGVLDILVIQAEGKRPMGVRDFLAGHPLRVGDRFGAP